MNFVDLTSENITQASSMEIENEIVNLILRLANLWTRAGYREKTIALFQALVELNLFSPKFPGAYSLEDRLATFEPFWESGFPRFGEVGALGWAKVAGNKTGNSGECNEIYSNPNNNAIEDKLIQGYLMEKNSRPNIVPNNDEDEIDCDEKSGESLLWLKLELERERKHWSPWRSRGKKNFNNFINCSATN